MALKIKLQQGDTLLSLAYRLLNEMGEAAPADKARAANDILGLEVKDIEELDDVQLTTLIARIREGLGG